MRIILWQSLLLAWTLIGIVLCLLEAHQILFSHPWMWFFYVIFYVILQGLIVISHVKKHRKRG